MDATDSQPNCHKIAASQRTVKAAGRADQRIKLSESAVSWLPSQCAGGRNVDMDYTGLISLPDAVTREQDCFCP